MNQKQSWESEFEGKETELSQAILGALEYRCFSDCGKYIDGTLLSYIKPIVGKIIQQAISKREKEISEEVKQLKRGMIGMKSEKDFIEDSTVNETIMQVLSIVNNE